MKKIRLTGKCLFEAKRKKLQQQYTSDVELPVTGNNLHLLYNKVPGYIRNAYKTAKFEYIPGMCRLFKQSEKRINESVIKFPKSLPYEIVHKSVIADIFKTFMHPEQCTISSGKSKMDEHGVSGHITISIPVTMITNGINEHLIDLMHHAGYYLAYQNSAKLNGNTVWWWQFEPYVYYEVRETLSETIYHVTKVEYIDSIKANGLIANRNPNCIFDYPPRNYMFNTPDRKSFQTYAYTADKLNNEGEFAVCFIDTSLTDAIFYTVPNYIERDGIYTYDNIAKEAISQINIDKI